MSGNKYKVTDVKELTIKEFEDIYGPITEK